MHYPLSNLHTHSNMSDGKNSLEEMILAAIDRKFISLGLSDHGWASYDSESCIPLEKEPEYAAECRRLQQKYADQIEIAVGYEHDALNPNNDLTPYDYIIESVHRVYVGGEYLSIDGWEAVLKDGIRRHYGGDPYGVVNDYYDAVCRSIESGRGQILGHMDLVTKFNEGDKLFSTSDPRFMNRALEALKLAVEKDMIVEINTGAMSRGYRTAPYPNPALLKALHDMGGRITISSDCHRAEWIDFAFDQAADYARSTGFKESWIWQSNALNPIAL